MRPRWSSPLPSIFWPKVKVAGKPEAEDAIEIVGRVNVCGNREFKEITPEFSINVSTSVWKYPPGVLIAILGA